jgi:glyoxylase-like metal-dependent hydrolase (beta-lactamase superfamily II)
MRVIELLGNSQRLDGGAMFGNAPRAVWKNWLPPDDLGRVDLNCRALLIEHQGIRVLLETGIGNFFSPEKRERFGVVEPNHVLLESLAKRGLSDQDIDVVILSHLHFDHAGGLLASYSEDAVPRLLFPNARFLVSDVAFERAKHPHPRDRASFIPELPGLLEASGRLELIPASAPASTLGPAFTFLTTDGHTPGMLHTTVHGIRERIFFCADLVPGVPWVHLPITMGYDRCAERLVDEKTRLFDRFERDGSWLFFTHDPQVALARIARNGKGHFAVTETRNQLSEWLILDP